jgi:carbamoyltransferase
MSIILGLNCNHADSSACLIKNGELLIAIEEERINRVKHWAGLPIKSIEECLKYSNLRIEDITDISINTNPMSNIKEKIIYFLKNYLLGGKKYEIAKRIKKKLDLKKDINKHFNPSNLNKNVKIHYIDHHLSHIASAYFPSNFDDAVGLSIDGFGDFASVCIAKCNKNKIKIIKKYLFPHSLGVFYESFTQLIGFKNYGDEYKMMGLSSFGKPTYYNLILENVFKKSKKIELDLKYFNYAHKNFSYKFEGQPNQNNLYNLELEKLLNIKDLKSENINDMHKNIASSAQKVFEKKLFEICEDIKKMNISKNLVYAGGCALNSLANKKIQESNLFENIFIPYAPGDGGGSLGSAFYVQKKGNKKEKLSNLNSPYIGTSYTNEFIKTIIDKKEELKKFDIKYYEEKSDLYPILANLIYHNKIVGFFNNKMEFGARSLGNRSIIANPCGKNIKEIINLKIKRRESFRPFAPAILKSEKKKWFYNNRENPYMSSVEEIRIEKRNIIPAVTHIDGSGRIQTVTKETNEDFHNLINEFFRLSNVPILLNTSFNENEPIVMEPKHAIDCFLRTDMDILVLNNYLISR